MTSQTVEPLEKRLGVQSTLFLLLRGRGGEVKVAILFKFIYLHVYYYVHAHVFTCIPLLLAKTIFYCNSIQGFVESNSCPGKIVNHSKTSYLYIKVVKSCSYEIIIIMLHYSATNV